MLAKVNVLMTLSLGNIAIVSQAMSHQCRISKSNYFLDNVPYVRTMVYYFDYSLGMISQLINVSFISGCEINTVVCYCLFINAIDGSNIRKLKYIDLRCAVN